MSFSLNESDEAFESESTLGLSADFNESTEQQSLIRTREIMKKYSKLFLGISNSSFSIVHLLSYKLLMRSESLTSYDCARPVSLVIRKLRLNESFQLLGLEFGISSQPAGRIFDSYLSFVADHLKELWFWSAAESITKMLPIPFRKHYSKVQSIIDCFEIEIEKPSDPVL